MSELSLLDAVKDPQMRHAIVVHTPVALAGLALLAAIVSAIMKNNRTLRVATVVAYLLLLLSGLLAVNTGEGAEEQLTRTLPNHVYEVLEEHEHMAEKVWIFASVAAGIVALAGVLPRKWRTGGSWVGVLAGLATAGWLTVTAHHGGLLVYQYGLATELPIDTPLTGDDSASVVAETDGPDVTDPPEDVEVPPAPDARLAHFRKHVQPVLEENCVRCHNPARKKRAGGLDQTSIASLLEGGMSGPAVVPGNPDESWLVMAVRHEVEDLEMPPDADRLPDETIANLEQWIRDGAVWEEGALFEPPSAE